MLTACVGQSVGDRERGEVVRFCGRPGGCEGGRQPEARRRGGLPEDEGRRVGVRRGEWQATVRGRWEGLAGKCGGHAPVVSLVVGHGEVGGLVGELHGWGGRQERGGTGGDSKVGCDTIYWRARVLCDMLDGMDGKWRSDKSMFRIRERKRSTGLGAAWDVGPINRDSTSDTHSDHPLHSNHLPNLNNNHATA